jgi:3-oxoadipate enol-lactonase
MTTLKLASGELHYSLQGDGVPLTLVHGVGGDHELWNGVINALGRGYRILTMDLRGHGLSSKSKGPYSLDLFRDDLLALLDHVGFKHTHLAGFSLGGLISQKVAIDAGDRLLSVAIISAIAGRTEQDFERVRERAALLRAQGAHGHLVNAVDRWFTDEFVENNPEVMEWRRKKSLQNDPDSYAAAYQVFAENDLADQLHKVTVPTLAITGERDVGSPPRMSRLIADTVQDGSVIILPNLKHSVLLEAPDMIAGLLADFVAAKEN